MSTSVLESLAWAPRDYVTLPEIPAHWKVIDVGPGAYPLKRANLCVDRSPEILAPISDAGQATMISDINEGLPGIGTKEFDYAWCSHLLEHVNDPAECCRVLGRIAKAGTIVMPSFYKESLFNFEEKTHQWLVVPNPTTGQPPIFIRHNRHFIAPLESDDVKQAMAMLYRVGSNHDCTIERNLRAWYQVNEAHTDVVYHWRGTCEVIVHP